MSNIYSQQSEMLSRYFFFHHNNSILGAAPSLLEGAGQKNPCDAETGSNMSTNCLWHLSYDPTGGRKGKYFPSSSQTNPGQLVNEAPKRCGTPVMFARVTQHCRTGTWNRALRWIIVMSCISCRNPASDSPPRSLCSLVNLIRRRRWKITSPGDPGVSRTGPEQRLQ